MTSQYNNSAVNPQDVTVTPITANNHPQYMNHETVYKIHAPKHGVTAFIGIHSTALGPALGGIRYKHYEDETAALADVLRLSEAMTWKNAAGALDHGGGKGVIMAPENTRKPDQTTLGVMACALNIINENGAVYYGAEDMNMDETALNTIAKTAPWIKGATLNDPTLVSGTPSPLTAIGVVECMKIAALFKLGKKSLKDVRISMQGLGAVGGAMAKHLHDEGAILTGCDTNASVFDDLAAQGVTIKRAGLDEIYDSPADIFAPNAIGGTLSNENIRRLQNASVQIICGAANNQQEDQIGNSQSKLLHKIGMLYCPDYIVNAGGVIWVAMVGKDAKTITQDITAGVPKRFEDILELSRQHPDKDMASIARDYAKKRVERAKENNAKRKAG